MSATPVEPKRDSCLKGIIPFSYLTDDRRRDVESALRFHLFEPGDVVYRAACVERSSDDGDDAACDCESTAGEYRMYICIEGGFVYTDGNGRIDADDIMLPGSYFGERAAIFRTPHEDDIRAISGRRSSAWSLSSEMLVKLLKEHNPRFALALASDLRNTQGIFDPFLAFHAFAFSAFHEPVDRPLDFGGLLSRYRLLKSALHPYVDDANTIDYGAWSYALRRLPESITRSYNIVCSKRIINVLDVSNGSGEDIETTQETDLESHLSGPGKPIHTDARRRTGWEVMPGKLFILLRELLSDYLDVLTCMCIHATEMTKLWRRLRPIATIVMHLTKGQNRIEKGEDEKEVTDEILKTICKGRLHERDIEGLKKLWPKGGTLRRLLDIVIHHADYTVYLDKRGISHAGSADERWSRRVREMAVKLVGEFHNVAGSNLRIDIVSSNTHSVLNCLSPYIHSNRDKFMSWGKENLPELFEGGFNNDMDILYPIVKEYFKVHPDEEKRVKDVHREWGIMEMVEMEFTGINVQLFDVNKLKSSGCGFDDLIPGTSVEGKFDGQRHLLVNIDYCFGSQGEIILRLLLLNFGQLVKSINIIGKAGGLASGCQRGDILFPTHVLDENASGEMRSVDNFDLSPRDLCELSQRKVHVGPVITVLGTVLQSRELLLFYERLWHATGMEMEASWYLRAIEEARHLGLLEDGTVSRFLYYVSDTPLEPSSSLATSMTLAEGIAPLYSITRLILSKVLSAEKIATAPQTTKKGKSEDSRSEFARTPSRRVVRTSFNAC